MLYIYIQVLHGCYIFLHCLSYLINRESSPLVEVIGGQPGCSRGVERHQRPSDERNNTQVVCVCVIKWRTKTQWRKLLITLFTFQVVTEMSSEEDRITCYHPALPSNFNFLSAYSSPLGKSPYHWEIPAHLPYLYTHLLAIYLHFICKHLSTLPF